MNNKEFNQKLLNKHCKLIPYLWNLDIITISNNKIIAYKAYDGINFYPKNKKIKLSHYSLEKFHLFVSKENFIRLLTIYVFYIYLFETWKKFQLDF